MKKDGVFCLMFLLNNSVRKYTTKRLLKAMDFLNPESVYNLANIREDLIRMEDTIIFNMIERSDFPTMKAMYEVDSDEIKIPNFHGSFLDWIFQQHEIIESQVRRYQSPDQYPFYPHVVKESFLPPIKYPKLLASYFREVSVTQMIKDMYLEKMIPVIAKYDGVETENFGSTSLVDITTLQSLSRRIHFGMFVAEAKFQSNRELYTELILNKDVDGIMENITNAAVEAKILERLLAKAKAYGSDPTLVDSNTKINPEVVVGIYRDLVIPLTKKVEVDYLLRRLEDKDF